MYIGQEPATSFTGLIKQDFTVSATTSYTLSHSVNSSVDIALYRNFVRQEPETAYTCTGTSLTLTSATVSGDDLYCIYLGQALQTVNPANNSVGITQLNVSDGSSGQALTTNGSGGLSFATVGGVNKNLFLAYNNSGDTISNATWTKVTIDTEVYDTASAFDVSNYRFTVPSGEGGYYKLYGMVNGRNTSNRLRDMQTAFYKNGSHISTKYGQSHWNHADSGDGNFRGFSLTHSIIVNLSAGDYIELYTYITVSTGSPIIDEISIFGGYKLNT